MSGAEDDESSAEWQWAHVMWQKRGIRMEDWAEMPDNIRLAYIASEELASECPLDSSDQLAKVYIKRQ